MNPLWVVILAATVAAEAEGEPDAITGAGSFEPAIVETTPAPPPPSVVTLPVAEPAPEPEAEAEGELAVETANDRGPSATTTAAGEATADLDTGGSAGEAIALPRSGYFGWGIGFELPMVGIFAGVASKSRVGAGYTLGGAITYDITPSITARIYGSWGRTQRGSAPVSFQLSGEPQLRNQSAEWLTFDLGLGAAYRFREVLPAFAPFVGFDVGITLMDGYEFRFDESLEDLVYDKEQRRIFDNGRLFGQDVAFTGGIRGGVRLELDDWLASLVELRVSYIHGGEDAINNTLNGPDVRTVEEHIILVRGTFSVWVGL